MTLAESTKASGLQTRGMAEGMSCSATAILIKVIMLRARPKGRELIRGGMARFMMGSGEARRRRGTEFGREYMETVTSVSGAIVRPRVTESIRGSMVIGMRESGSRA